MSTKNSNGHSEDLANELMISALRKMSTEAVRKMVAQAGHSLSAAQSATRTTSGASNAVVDSVVRLMSGREKKGFSGLTARQLEEKIIAVLHGGNKPAGWPDTANGLSRSLIAATSHFLDRGLELIHQRRLDGELEFGIYPKGKLPAYLVNRTQEVASKTDSSATGDSPHKPPVAATAATGMSSRDKDILEYMRNHPGPIDISTVCVHLFGQDTRKGRSIATWPMRKLTSMGLIKKVRRSAWAFTGESAIQNQDTGDSKANKRATSRQSTSTAGHNQLEEAMTVPLDAGEINQMLRAAWRDGGQALRRVSDIAQYAQSVGAMTWLEDKRGPNLKISLGAIGRRLNGWKFDGKVVSIVGKSNQIFWQILHDASGETSADVAASS